METTILILEILHDLNKIEYQTSQHITYLLEGHAGFLVSAVCAFRWILLLGCDLELWLRALVFRL